jgi:hypothetical protein
MKPALILCLLATCIASTAVAQEEFMSRKMVGLLTEQEDDNLLKQALMGVASATTVKPFVKAEQAQTCSSLFNSYLTLTNYQLTQEQGTRYAAVVTDALANSRKIKYVEAPQEDTQACGIFVGFSLVPLKKKDHRVYELVVYVFDWQRARATGVQGADAFIQAGVVAFITRKLEGPRESPSKHELANFAFPMYEELLKSTLGQMGIIL